MKTHGIFWLINRAILFSLIGILSVWGTAYLFVPIVEVMDNVQRQAAAVILVAFFVFAFGCVWAFCKVTGRL